MIEAVVQLAMMRYDPSIQYCISRNKSCCLVWNANALTMIDLEEMFLIKQQCQQYATAHELSLHCMIEQLGDIAPSLANQPVVMFPANECDWMTQMGGEIELVYSVLEILKMRDFELQECVQTHGGCCAEVSLPSVMSAEATTLMQKVCTDYLHEHGFEYAGCRIAHVTVLPDSALDFRPMEECM
ncbi:MAG: hypothetical protein Q8P90_00060 [bacterium]|nr:hypothetical protein [bacterium]